MTPYFSDRFSLDDYITAKNVLRSSLVNPADKPHFHPLYLDPLGDAYSTRHENIIGSSTTYLNQSINTKIFRTAKWHFATVIYQEALSLTLKKFPSLQQVKWTQILPNWREVHLHPQHKEATHFMNNLMKDLCYSGEHSIHTGYLLEKQVNSYGTKTRLYIIKNLEEWTEEAQKPFWGRGQPDYKALITPQEFHFTWDEITPFILYPSAKLYELLNSGAARPPLSNLEKQMFAAVYEFDLPTTTSLIKKGARVNAINQYGETAFTSIAGALYYPTTQTVENDIAYEDFSPDSMTIDEQLAFLQALLDQGADPSLAFHQEADALMNATLQNNIPVIQFLLKNQARLNYNPWPDDNPNTCSQALEYADTDSYLEDTPQARQEYAKIAELLRAHGAILYLDET